MAHRVSNGHNYVTIGLGAWLILGIFVDGYAHNHGVVETFFTPWHGLLYSGFMASAVWVAWLVYRYKQSQGGSWKDAVPVGYGLGIVGIAVFLSGGLIDMGWHIVFGIEQNTAALLSPSHLMLLVGALLILSSPYRAAWSDEQISKPGWRLFVPPFLSVVLTVGAVCFFLMFAWMFRYNLPSRANVDWLWNAYGIEMIQDNNEIMGICFILLNTIVLMYPIFLMLARWQVPVGTFTLTFVLVVSLVNVLDGFQYYPAIVMAAIAGLAGDGLYRWLQPYKGRIWAYRLIALSVPIIWWSCYFGWMAVNVGIGWEIELWTGAIVEAALASFALSLLAIPTKQRQHDGSS